MTLPYMYPQNTLFRAFFAQTENFAKKYLGVVGTLCSLRAPCATPHHCASQLMGWHRSLRPSVCEPAPHSLWVGTAHCIPVYVNRHHTACGLAQLIASQCEPAPHSLWVGTAHCVPVYVNRHRSLRPSVCEPAPHSLWVGTAHCIPVYVNRHHTACGLAQLIASQCEPAPHSLWVGTAHCVPVYVNRHRSLRPSVCEPAPHSLWVGTAHCVPVYVNRHHTACGLRLVCRWIASGL